MSDIVEEIRVGLAHSLVGALKAAGEKDLIKVDHVPDLRLRRPGRKNTGLCHQPGHALAKPARLAPRKVAEILVNLARTRPGWKN